VVPVEPRVAAAVPCIQERADGGYVLLRQSPAVAPATKGLRRTVSEVGSAFTPSGYPILPAREASGYGFLSVMVAVHMSAGALAGLATRTPAAALALGLASHAVLDALPHDDVLSARTEGFVAGALFALIAYRTRADPRALAGGVGGAIPDLEHVMRLPGAGGRVVFPSHAFPRLHASLPVPFRARTATQVAAAAAMVAAMGRRSR
jgi:hypothetical protein